MFNAILLAVAATVVGATADPSAPAPAPQATPAAAQRYCVESNVTGSRIAVRECHTRGDWLKLGFDPLDPK